MNSNFYANNRNFFSEFNTTQSNRKAQQIQVEDDYQIEDPFELLNDETYENDFDFEMNQPQIQSINFEQESVCKALDNIKNSHFTPNNPFLNNTSIIHTNRDSSTQKNDASSHNLRAVNELDVEYRSIFKEFKYFNKVQSLLYDELLNTNNSLVISAPTGSGKTTILELGIVRVLKFSKNRNFKIIYLAPLKALCNEKFTDWKHKFCSFNLKCIELTGDTDSEDDFIELENANIICTTPEKWNIITRRHKQRRLLMASIRLFLIDEIHILGENMRGAIIEVVVSRMKTSDALSVQKHENNNGLRFLAISATIPNIGDIAEWLSNNKTSTRANFFKVDESCRPVELRKVVLGYPCPDRISNFIFDLRLNYKLNEIVQNYSNGKPTLIFCSTRKSTQQAAITLTQTTSNTYVFNADNEHELRFHSTNIKDAKLKEYLVKGVGIHHAGISTEDRKLVENLFLNSKLRILLCTSTLAIGINLPAHLVIIKSTEYYVNQKFIEYSQTQVQQMIGRAGRPQFDKTGTAVILTKAKNKQKYETLIECDDVIESNLHLNLIEHFNNEIVLRTIATIDQAIAWLKSTYLYVRLSKNPTYYGAQTNLTKEQIEKYLEDLCTNSLNALIESKLVKLNQETSIIVPTSNGLLMSKYCISYQTMKMFIEAVDALDEPVTKMHELLELLSKSKEFEDIQLRTNEKSILNELNRCKDREAIRFSLPGKIKTPQMKVNVLMQAQFSCLTISDFSLMQDALRIMRSAQKLSKCLMEYILTNVCKSKNYELVLNSILLTKCFSSKLWHDSPHLLKQFNRIGPTTSQAFITHNLITFEEIQSLSSLEIETIANKHTPFGSDLLKTLAKIPRFEIEANFVTTNEFNIQVEICIQMSNYDVLQECGTFLNPLHQFIIIIGDEKQNLIENMRLSVASFLSDHLKGRWQKKFSLYKFQNGCFINVSLISLSFVGIDVHGTFQLFDNSFTSQSIINDEQECEQPRANSKRKRPTINDKTSLTQPRKSKRTQRPKQIFKKSPSCELSFDDDSLPVIVDKYPIKKHSSIMSQQLLNIESDVDDDDEPRERIFTSKQRPNNSLDTCRIAKSQKQKRVSFKDSHEKSQEVREATQLIESTTKERVFTFKKNLSSIQEVKLETPTLPFKKMESNVDEDIIILSDYDGESNENDFKQESHYFKQKLNAIDEDLVELKKFKAEIVEKKKKAELKSSDSQEKCLSKHHIEMPCNEATSNAQTNVINAKKVSNTKSLENKCLKEKIIDDNLQLIASNNMIQNLSTEPNDSNESNLFERKFDFKKTRQSYVQDTRVKSVVSTYNSQNLSKPQENLKLNNIQEAIKKVTKHNFLEETLSNLNKYKQFEPPKAKLTNVNDLHFKYVDQIDILKSNFDSHKNHNRVKVNSKDNPLINNLPKDSILQSFEKKEILNSKEISSVQAQLDQLFDKSVDETDCEEEAQLNGIKSDTIEVPKVLIRPSLSILDGLSNCFGLDSFKY